MVSDVSFALHLKTMGVLIALGVQICCQMEVGQAGEGTLGLLLYLPESQFPHLPCELIMVTIS